MTFRHALGRTLMDIELNTMTMFSGLMLLYMYIWEGKLLGYSMLHSVIDDLYQEYYYTLVFTNDKFMVPHYYYKTEVMML